MARGGSPPGRCPAGPVPGADELLSPAARELVERILGRRGARASRRLPLGVWVVATLAPRSGAGAAALKGLAAPAALQAWGRRVRRGRAGRLLSAELLQEAAFRRAEEMRPARAARASLAELAGALLELAAREIEATGAGTRGDGPGSDLEITVADLSPSAPAPPPARGSVRAPRATPWLERFGRDLTAAAAAGRLLPLIGRDAEIEAVLNVLCQRMTRNPLLVGPTGAGKSAVAEGLAARLAGGNVPDCLRGHRLIALEASALLAGAGAPGELEERVGGILAEAARGGILLFIDEAHALVGAGGAEGRSDLAGMFKPALARGEVACVAATTSGEFRRSVERDAALARRFEVVEVLPLSEAGTLEALRGLWPALRGDRRVELAGGVLEWLVRFAAEHLPHQCFPGKAVNLLDRCLGAAALRNLDVISLADAEAVARRAAGAVESPAKSLRRLRAALAAGRLLPPAVAGDLAGLLEATLRGVDARQERPNAVLLLAGAEAERAGELAGTVAEALYGDPDRLVRLDLGRCREDHERTLLLGAPPGYVGYGEELPIHELLRTPACVLLMENADLCHPEIRLLLARGFESGSLQDAAGTHIPLSEAVVLLTAASDPREAPPVGFHGQSGGDGAALDGLERRLEAAFMEQVDLVCAGPGAVGVDNLAWIETELLERVKARFAVEGVDLEWEPSVPAWLAREGRGLATRREWEHLVDRRLLAALAPLADAAEAPGAARRKVRVRAGDAGLSFDALVQDPVKRPLR